MTYQGSKFENIIRIQVGNGESLSNAFYVGNSYILCGIQIPATVQLDELAFERSLDSTDGSDGTYSSLYDSSGNLITFSAAASQNISPSDAGPESVMIGGWLKLRTRLSSSNQTQSQNTAFYILLRR